MTNQICNCIVLVIFTVPLISSNFNLEQIESVIPLRSVLQIMGNVKTGNLNPWQSGLLEFLLQNQNLPKVITADRYYRTCKLKGYISSKDFTRLLVFHYFFCVNWKQNQRKKDSLTLEHD